MPKGRPTPKRSVQRRRLFVGGGESFMRAIDRLPRAPRGKGANTNRGETHIPAINADAKRARRAERRGSVEFWSGQKRHPEPSPALVAHRQRNAEAAERRRTRIREALAALRAVAS